MGLLVLRFTLCAFLVHLLDSRASLAVDTVVAAIAGVLLAVGLWTPIAGALAAVSLLWNGVPDRTAWPCLFAAPIGIALSMVGPGAVSIDARLFGRKRVIFDDRRD